MHCSTVRALMHFYAIGAARQQLECTGEKLSAVECSELRNAHQVKYSCSTKLLLHHFKFY